MGTASSTYPIFMKSFLFVVARKNFGEPRHKLARQTDVARIVLTYRTLSWCQNNERPHKLSRNKKTKTNPKKYSDASETITSFIS